MNDREYELSFGPGEKRVAFFAKGIVQAIVRAEDLVSEGRSAVLVEDGVPMCRVSAHGFLMFEDYCRPVTGV